MILVFGKNGQVAQALAQHKSTLCLGRNVADLARPGAAAAAIAAHRPEAVINAAAYTAVDHAEADEERAALINGHVVLEMARACVQADIPLVYISTDYVFDGKGTDPWQPDDLVAPLNAYGRSKALGEANVIAAGGRFAILRTSWVVSPWGQNFATTMLRLGTTQDSVRVVDDQIGALTPACDIAAACMTMASHLQRNPKAAGIYHFQGNPWASWADVAETLFDVAGLPCQVERVSSAEYPTPARRPHNSRLDCSTTCAQFGITLPDMGQTLAWILRERRGSGPPEV